MPSKAKAGARASPSSDPKGSPPEPAPETVAERSAQLFYQTNPVQKLREQVGLSGLSPVEKKTYAHARLVQPVSQRKVAFSSKGEREFWKQVAREGIPSRRLGKDHIWGHDRNGRDIGTYKLPEFRDRSLKQAKLAALHILHCQFLARRDTRLEDGADVEEQDTEDEKIRRREMAALEKDLYGTYTGSLLQDPAWDDVIPIPQNEPPNALAQIAYPDDYAEAVSYLRAVMAAEECSVRALRLTEHVIAMNPAHYTVWLYRFKILSTLGLSVPEEMAWLNGVSLLHIKNYQIWHHRQLLLDSYYPAAATDEDTIKQLSRSETAFINQMLEEDSKNYHVWSYRQYLVEKLGMWDVHELASTQNWIEQDVRNNSAWSHRFFLVFSNPHQATPTHPTEPDPHVPAQIVDRELQLAQDKIRFAPQNQSPWNYLRGVLVKGSRPLSDVEDFAAQYVASLGQEDEEVTSSHALDLLADIYWKKGEADRALLCLRRLGEKWDPVREGYWKYRATALMASAKET